MDIKSFSEAKINVLSGLTVALALVPEAIAFAFVAHVHPLIGLYAAFMVSLITSLIGGRPGMISGATGALAVVALEAIDLLAERYMQLGKKLHLRHLSPDCLELLDKARSMIEVNVLEDPLYHPADNRLG